MDAEPGGKGPVPPVAGQATISPQALKRWKRRSALHLTPAVVTRLIAAWALLSLALAPFLDFPLIGAWGAVLGLVYLGLLFLIPRLWLYVIPLAVVLPDFASYTGREFYTLLDLAVLTTIAGSLCFNRYHIQVLRPSRAVVGIEVLLVLSLAGYTAWHSFISPPGALKSLPWNDPANAYMAVKGMLWALLLMPAYGYAMSRHKAATTRDLTTGCACAVMVLLMLTGIDFFAGLSAPAAALPPLYAASAYLGHYAGNSGALILLLIPMLLYSGIHNRHLLIPACGLVLTCCLALFVSSHTIALAVSAATVLCYLGLEALGAPLRRRCAQCALLVPVILLLLVVDILNLGKPGVPPVQRTNPESRELTVPTLLLGHGAGSSQRRDNAQYSAIEISDRGGKSLLQLHPNPDLRFRSLLGQPVRLKDDGLYTLAVSSRIDAAATLTFLLCKGLPRVPESEPENCHVTALPLEQREGQLARHSVELEAADILRALPDGKRPNLFLLRNDSDGSSVEIDSVALIRDDLNLLRNSSFTEAFDLWIHHFPGRESVGSSLYRDLFYEVGALSIVTLLWLMGLSLYRASRTHSATSLAPAFAAAVAGIALLGLADSPLQSPRVALVFYCFLFANLISLGPPREQT
ncbi:hypothetical protein GCM10027297_36200 [Parahaliea aestuarii]